MSSVIYEKKDDLTLTVISSPNPVEIVDEKQDYDYNFLIDQEIKILKQKNDFVKARNEELEEVRTLISKCDELGIKGEKEVELETLKEAEEI